MGTDIDSALDEVYYGRHNRHDGGIPASLGARTIFDIKRAHQRMLKQQESERLERERRQKRKRAREEAQRRYLEESEAIAKKRAETDETFRIYERRRLQTHSEISLWQEEGWVAWWAALRLASRNEFVREADYNETDPAADTVRYMLLRSLLKQLSLFHGFSENTGRSVAAAIFVRGLASWNLHKTD
jgi:hypothetical protein